MGLPASGRHYRKRKKPALSPARVFCLSACIAVSGRTDQRSVPTDIAGFSGQCRTRRRPVNANAGIDRVNANAGTDRVNADAGTDRVNGNAGTDRVNACAGTDR